MKKAVIIDMEQNKTMFWRAMNKDKLRWTEKGLYCNIRLFQKGYKRDTICIENGLNIRKYDPIKGRTIF